jgi:hypothetical protein
MPQTMPQHQTGFFEARIIDQPQDDLFLFSNTIGRIDLRKCRWFSAGFFNRTEGAIKWPRPWKYDANHRLTEEGDQLLLAFLNNNTANPIIFPSVIPVDADEFFGGYYQAAFSSSDPYPIRTAYNAERLAFREKNASREFSITEEKGEVTVNLLGQNQTINVRINNGLVLKIKDGEVNVGGDGSEAMVLGNSFMALFNQILAAIIAHEHTAFNSPSAGLTALQPMTSAELSTVGKVK